MAHCNWSGWDMKLDSRTLNTSAARRSLSDPCGQNFECGSLLLWVWSNYLWTLELSERYHLAECSENFQVENWEWELWNSPEAKANPKTTPVASLKDSLFKKLLRRQKERAEERAIWLILLPRNKKHDSPIPNWNAPYSIFQQRRGSICPFGIEGDICGNDHCFSMRHCRHIHLQGTRAWWCHSRLLVARYH